MACSSWYDCSFCACAWLDRNRSAQEEQQAGRLAPGTLEEQWAGNEVLIQESKAAQGKLREALKDRGKVAKEKAPPSKKEQAFLDAANYMKRTWRGGKQARPQEAAREEGPPAAQAGLEFFLEETPFHGLGGVTAGGAAPEVEFSEPSGVDATKGLKPVAEPSGALEALGFEVPAEGKGSMSYTFLRSGGDAAVAAELSLTFTRRDAIPRLAALILLGLVPAVLVWGRVARKRRAR